MDKTRQPRYLPARSTLPLLVLGGSLLVTGAVSFQTVKAAELESRLGFQNAVQRTEDRIRSRLEIYTGLLRSGAALIAARDTIGPQAFRTYAERLALRNGYPGVRGLGFSAVITPANAEQILTRMRSKQYPSFRYWPRGDGQERHAVLFLEPPVPENTAALGFDLYRESALRQAMDRARRTGAPAASERVVGPPGPDLKREPEFLIFVPVYRRGSVPATESERQRALIGYVFSPLRPQRLFQGVLDAENRPGIDFRIFDGTRPAVASLLFGSHSLTGDRQGSRFTAARQIEVAGETWTILYGSRAGTEAASTTAALSFTLIPGILISVLLSLVTWSQVRGLRAAQESNAVLREADEALRIAAGEKDAVLAMLAHELRNPLAPIMASAHLLASEGAANPRVLRHQEIISRQAGIMARLLDDLLDVSRITRKDISLRKQPLDLRTIARNAVESSRPVTDERRHLLTMSLPPGPVWVLGDPVRLEQVVWNLLSNAAKYSKPEGHIRLVLEVQPGDGVDAGGNGPYSGGAGVAVLSVRDTGVGITPELLPRIFDLFTQGSRSLDRPEGGLGVGLTVASDLVRMHGGSLEAHSDGADKGSDFVVRLPLTDDDLPMGPPDPSANRIAASPHAASDCQPTRVLIIDDNRAAAETLAELVELWGYEVRVADDGPTGLVLAREHAPEVVLLDIGLPGMDGYEVARRFRADPSTSSLRLIAVTGYSQEEDRRRSREAGIDLHLAKPVDPSALKQALATPNGRTTPKLPTGR